MTILLCGGNNRLEVGREPLNQHACLNEKSLQITYLIIFQVREQKQCCLLIFEHNCRSKQKKFQM